MSMSGKLASGLPQYKDKDRTFLRSDLNYAIKKIDEAMGGAGSVSSVNGKVGEVILYAEDITISEDNEKTIPESIAELESIVINAEATETILGFVVPKLTNEQITQAYNGIVAGKRVVIVDSLDSLNMSVYSANNISGDIVINAIFNDKLILTYKEDETTPIIEASLIGKLNAETFTFVLEDGTEVKKDIAIYQGA